MLERVWRKGNLLTLLVEMQIVFILAYFTYSKRPGSMPCMPFVP